MDCCGTQGQVIELRGGEEPLAMVRCVPCGRREWRLDGRPLPVDAAFDLLAQAYRSVPRQARAARDRTAAQTAARAAARAARQAALRAATPAPPPREELAGLLRGWTVLGATG